MVPTFRIITTVYTYCRNRLRREHSSNSKGAAMVFEGKQFSVSKFDGKNSVSDMGRKNIQKARYAFKIIPLSSEAKQKQF